MSLKKTSTLFILFFCLFLAACGSVTPPITRQPTPTPDPNHQETQLQASQYIRPSIINPSNPDQGINLPDIRVRGLCNFAPPTPILVSTDSPPRVVVPAGKVLLLKRRSSDEQIEEQNLSGGLPNFFSPFIVIAAPGPTTVAGNTELALSGGDKYGVVSTAQAGDMVAALVTENLPLHCAPLPDTDPFDSSLVDLSKQYPFPARFRVCDSDCES